MYEEIKKKIHSGMEKGGYGQETYTMELKGPYWPNEKRKLERKLNSRIENSLFRNLKRIYVNEFIELMNIKRCPY